MVNASFIRIYLIHLESPWQERWSIVSCQSFDSKICVSTSTAFSGYSICCVYKTLHILTSVEQYVHNTVMDLSRECWNQDFSNGTERT